MNDAVRNEPFVNIASGPGFVDRVGGFEIGDLDIVEERSAASRSRSGDDTVFLEPGSELVVVPSGEDVVFGIVKLLRSLVGCPLSLGRRGVVGGRNGRSGLVGGVTVDCSRRGRCPAIVS